MKRFYCTICGRVKRVRKLPVTVRNDKAENPKDRKGKCDKHYDERGK